MNDQFAQIQKMHAKMTEQKQAARHGKGDLPEQRSMLCGPQRT